MDAFNRFLACGLSLCLAVPALAATTTINGVTYDSGKANNQANVNVNASLRLKKVFLFPSIDDLGGVLAPKLDEKMVQLFSRNSRFDLIRDPQVMRALAPDEKTYAKAAMSPEVHKEAAKVTGADTTALLRTRSVGNDTEMTLEFRDSDGNLLFSEVSSIPGASPMNARWGLIDKLFGAVLAKIPFDGSVTGRTANTITIDLGFSMIRPGEEIELARIVSIQRHPLLGTVVGTDYVRAGKARVANTDKSISFAEILEENPGEVISAGTKVLRTRTSTVRRPEPGYPAEPRRQGREQPPKQEEADPFEERLKGEFDDIRPRYGTVGANLLYGSLSHSQANGATSSEYSGSGVSGTLEAEFWVTKNWILNGMYGFQNAALSGSSGEAGDTSWSRFEVFGGYRFFPEDIMENVQLTASLGYQIITFSIPGSTALNLGEKKYTGPALRLEGELALHRNHRVSAGFGFQPFSSLTEVGPSIGVPESATVISFHAGWNYRLSNNFWTKVGFQFDTASGSYENTATVTDKRFAIGPGLYYSF